MNPANLLFFLHPHQRGMEQRVDLRMCGFFRKKFAHEFAQKKRHRTAPYVVKHRKGNVGATRFFESYEPFRPFSAHAPQLEHRAGVPFPHLPVFAPALRDPQGDRPQGLPQHTNHPTPVVVRNYGEHNAGLTIEGKGFGHRRIFDQTNLQSVPASPTKERGLRLL